MATTVLTLAFGAGLVYSDANATSGLGNKVWDREKPEGNPA